MTMPAQIERAVTALVVDGWDDERDRYARMAWALTAPEKRHTIQQIVTVDFTMQHGSDWSLACSLECPLTERPDNCPCDTSLQFIDDPPPPRRPLWWRRHRRWVIRRWWAGR